MAGTRGIIHRLAPEQEASDESFNKPRYPWPFSTMSTPAIRALARRIRTASALRLFLTLPDILDWQEWRQLNQTALGEELQIAQPHISRALKELLEIGVIQRQGKGPRQEWRLSLDFGWRGNVADFAAEATRQGKSFPKKPNRDRSNVAEGICRNTAQPTTTSERQPEQPRNRQRDLNLPRVIRGGRTTPAA